jgi:hypothetical protein
MSNQRIPKKNTESNEMDLVKNEVLKEEFTHFVQQLSTKEILWPEEYLDSYDKKFVYQEKQRKLIPFLNSNLEKLQYLELKIQQWIQNQTGRYEHPYITYYYLQKFLEEITKKDFDQSVNKATQEVLKAIKSKSKKTKHFLQENLESKENDLKKSIDLINKLKKKLQVPKKWHQYNAEKIYQELLHHFEDLSIENYHTVREKINLEIELEHYKNPDFVHPSYKQDIEQYKQQIQQLQKELLQERSKNELLEKEVQRLTELIIENPTITVQQEELESLKKEYRLLSEKYDLLVSKNIELRNLLEQQNHVKTLQDALNKVRDRINKILKTGGLNEEVMIIKIKQEIEELQRARIYLGKALYDLGLLYLRLGKKENALIELRAARELGVEDPEVNRIINMD